MIRPKASSLYLTLCLLFVGVLTATASDDVGILRARMDSLRRVIPTKTGADRQSAWTRLYYNAFHIDSDTLALQVLNEWIADAHIHGDYWSESVARQNKIVDFYNTARYDSVKTAGTEAMNFCAEYGLTRKYFEAWHLIICSYHITGKYNTAIREGLRMHEEALAEGDVFGQSMAYYNMGNVYYTMRHFNQSVKAFEQSVALLQHEDSTVSVLLEVYPYYGDGVPEEAREQIFGEFVKLDDFTSGTGIGLSLARNIARKLGGDIVLDVQYTPGACFIMTLPFS